MNAIKILLTGASGFLGSCLLEALCRAGASVLAASRREQPEQAGVQSRLLDLRTTEEAHLLMRNERPNVVIHAAAIADLEACERDPAAAFAVNTRASETLAKAAAGTTARFVLISTDQVFAGDRGNYSEQDAARPLNVYGATKLEAEERALRAHAGTLILRLPLLYGTSSHERGATNRLLASLRRGERPLLFTDEYRSPLEVRDASSAIAELALKGAEGLFHLGGPRRLSRFELGLLIARQHGFDADHLLAACADAEASGPRRPRDVSLNSDKVKGLLTTTRLRAPDEVY